MNIVMWIHWVSCMVGMGFSFVIDDTSGASSFAAASIVILAIGAKK